MRKDTFFKSLLCPSKTDPLYSLKLFNDETTQALEQAISRAYSSPLRRPKIREEIFDRMPIHRYNCCLYPFTIILSLSFMKSYCLFMDFDIIYKVAIMMQSRLARRLAYLFTLYPKNAVLKSAQGTFHVRITSVRQAS